MKISDAKQQPQANLMQLFANKKTSTAKHTAPAAAVSAKTFDAALREEAASEEKNEKKPAQAPHKRVSAAPLEALMVSHATTSRPASFIDTKKENLKVTAQATGDALAMRAKATTHQLPTAELHKPQQAEVGASKQHEKRSDTSSDKKSEEFKLAAASEAKPAAAASAPAMTEAVAQPQPMVATNPIAEAAPLAPVAPMMLADETARAVLLPTVARVTVEAGEAGRLNVQLKVNDGVTEIRATGPAAQLLESRQGELRVALAKEGLALGHFDLAQQQQQHSHSGGSAHAEFDEGTPTARKSAARTENTSDRVVTSDGRLHVKA
ncbi:MAG: hypothetical protein QM817_14755 [Archangium sp.]